MPTISSQDLSNMLIRLAGLYESDRLYQITNVAPRCRCWRAANTVNKDRQASEIYNDRMAKLSFLNEKNYVITFESL